ncbi:MAG TPA: hypothetical protein VE991_13255 [Acidimicrobiales bacterium]|nr:hypothetical protein [Acidimicrobiales bacterium]
MSVTCAAPDCDNPVARRPGRAGRPAIYCSPACRPSWHRTRGIAVEVQLDDNDDRRGGTDWLVQLRRGERVLVIRQGLGRFSATEFADNLRRLLAPAQQEGVAID